MTNKKKSKGTKEVDISKVCDYLGGKCIGNTKFYTKPDKTVGLRIIPQVPASMGNVMSAGKKSTNKNIVSEDKKVIDRNLAGIENSQDYKKIDNQMQITKFFEGDLAQLVLTVPCSLDDCGTSNKNVLETDPWFLDIREIMTVDRKTYPISRVKPQGKNWTYLIKAPNVDQHEAEIRKAFVVAFLANMVEVHKKKEAEGETVTPEENPTGEIQPEKTEKEKENEAVTGGETLDDFLSS